MKPNHVSDNCKMCANDSPTVLWVSNRFVSLGCSACGVVETRQIVPEIGEQEPVTLYNDVYYAGYLKGESLQRQFFQTELLRLGMERSPGTLLDVGCGTGVFIAEAAKMGWKVSAVEPSPVAAKLAQERTKISICNTTLLAAQLPVQAFDVVTFWDVLAHIPDVPAVLGEAGRLLKENGTLIIKTPNRPWRVFRAVSLLLGWRQRTAAELLHLPHQIWSFTPPSLVNTLRLHGFRVVTVRWVTEASIRPKVGDLIRKFRLKALARYTVSRGLVRFGGHESFVIYASKS